MSYDTAIVGGGLTGLVAGARLAAAGQRVVVLERAAEIGGRARSALHGRSVLNLGAHALYSRGHARRVLDELGVPWSGGQPVIGGMGVTAEGAYPLPITPWAWATTGLLDARSRAELARWMLLVGVGPLANWHGRPLSALLAAVHGDAVRKVISALVHVTTYCHDPDHLDAGAALAQLRLSLGNVHYLDGGWQTLVDGAARSLAGHGGTLGLGVRVERVEPGRVFLADEVIEAGTVILAVSPRLAARLTDSPALADHLATLRIARAACLDLVLESLPDPSTTFALGLDHPTYFSVHSAVADLGPEVVVHALAYLGPDEARDAEGELEALLDQVQPGWRGVVRHRRFLPALDVAAVRDGRVFGPEIPDRPGLLVAGDWVGPRGMLLDAALASAEQATDGILAGSGSARGREAA